MSRALAQTEQVINMTRKSVFAVAAILALGSLSLATDASAAKGSVRAGRGHVATGHVLSRHSPGAFVAGRHRAPAFVGPGHHRPALVRPRHHGPGLALPGVRRHFARGHHPHFWAGRWWYYGVGPCWQWSDFYGEYVWVCD